jgi:hypothetical protein
MVARGTKEEPRRKRAAARGGPPAVAAVTPLDYLLQVMRDPTAPAEMRFEAAKVAAPLVHASLAVTVHKGER